MSNKIGTFGQRWLAPMKGALIHFKKSDGYAMASHVALSLMMALFPFLIFATSLAGFLSTDTQGNGIIELVFGYWPDEIATPIIREIDVVLSRGSVGFLTLGIALALLFASNGVEAVRLALNRAYQVDDSRSMLKQRAQSLVFVFVGAILLLIISALLIFIPMYFSFVEIVPSSLYSSLLQSGRLRLPAAFCLLIFVVFACHYWLPGHRRPVSAIWPGIFLTFALWLGVAKLFSLYLKSFANYSATYAGLAGIMTALIFLYLMALILIFGAEYNSALQKYQSEA